jgi:ABC-type branched-subunit amino acid transport system permease subunit
VMTVIVGGLGTIRGALVGALAYVLMGEVMRFVPFLPADMVGYGRQAIIAAMLILVMLFRPEGIAGNYKL